MFYCKARCVEYVLNTTMNGPQKKRFPFYWDALAFGTGGLICIRMKYTVWRAVHHASIQRNVMEIRWKQATITKIAEMEDSASWGCATDVQEPTRIYTILRSFIDNSDKDQENSCSDTTNLALPLVSAVISRIQQCLSYQTFLYLSSLGPYLEVSRIQLVL